MNIQIKIKSNHVHNLSVSMLGDVVMTINENSIIYMNEVGNRLGYCHSSGRLLEALKIASESMNLGGMVNTELLSPVVCSDSLI